MRRTKIIATIGPSSRSYDVLFRLVLEGVSGFRLNFAHGTHEEKLEEAKAVRAIERELGTYVTIVCDLSGPGVRLGKVSEFYVHEGEQVNLVYSDVGKAEEKEIPVPVRQFFEVLEDGDIVLIDDGRVWLRVDKICRNRVVCTVLTSGAIRPGKGIGIKGKDLELPPLTSKDVEDIKFCVANGIADYFALSFVKRGDDVKILRDLLNDLGADDVGILAKIETKSAVDRVDEIVQQSDGVIIARGDLGITLGLEKVPIVQHEIVRKCRYRGKPSIIATQILESMVESPVPTRAEVVDIMVSVQEGVDAILLTNETAIGKYPVTCVTWLKRVLLEAEQRYQPEQVDASDDLYDKFAKGVASLADFIGAKLLIFTRRGTTARRIVKYRPRTAIYVATPSEVIARRLNIMWSVRSFVIEERDVGKALDRFLEHLKERGDLTYGDIVILTGGMRGGATDLARVEIVR